MILDIFQVPRTANTWTNVTNFLKNFGQRANDRCCVKWNFLVCFPVSEVASGSYANMLSYTTWLAGPTNLIVDKVRVDDPARTTDSEILLETTRWRKY